ncbi:MAG: type IV pilus twitching motility protein PilT [Bdellovibrionales bacterium]
MAEIDKLFKLMVQQNASDMHLSAGAPPYFRIHGDMVSLNHPPLESNSVQALIFEILTEKQKRTFIETWELDTSYQVEGTGRFRVNVFMQRRGVGGVFRVIPEKIKSAREMNIPQSILDMIDTPRGLVLVTGPTGSGKSTTLASLIHEINTTRREHVITIEDPIEFVHENKMALINQREVSSHTKSFSAALRAALREDPDIILVGELRDLETIQLAMTAAETGHLVFGTLHTNNAPKTVDRVIDVFPQAQQAQIRTMLSESLRGVVAQTLFPRVDKPGRIAAFEVLTNTHAVANLIREGKTHQIPSIMQTQMDQGMMTFEYHLNKLVADGRVDKLLANTFLGKKERKEADISTGTVAEVKVPGVTKAGSGLKITGVADSTQAAAAGIFKRRG